MWQRKEAQKKLKHEITFHGVSLMNKMYLPRARRLALSGHRASIPGPGADEEKLLVFERLLLTWFIPSPFHIATPDSVVKSTPEKGCCKRNRKEVLWHCSLTGINLW